MILFDFIHLTVDQILNKVWLNLGVVTINVSFLIVEMQRILIYLYSKACKTCLVNTM